MRLIDIRREERLHLLIAVAICFGIITAHTMAETARDALFLVHLPARHLPLAYLGIGIASFLLGKVSSFVVGRVGQRAAMSGILVLGAIVSTVFCLAFSRERGWMFYAFYIWVGTFATTSVIELWLFLARVFTVAQGKRLFGLIGTGASVGTFVGAAAAGAWARRLPIENLLLVVAGLQLVTALLPLGLPNPGRTDDTGHPHAFSVPGLQLVRKQPYLLRIAGLVGISSLTLMLVDYQFKVAAAQAVDAARLASFLGMVYAVLGGGALIVQMLSARIVRRFGVAVALGVLPALLIVGGMVLPMVGVLGRALAFRSADGTLRHSLHRVGMELLYMPLSPEVRNRVKAFIDGGIGRAAQATASVLLLGMAMAGLTGPLVALVICLGSAAWLWLAWTIRQPYIDLFLSQLDTRGVDTAVRLPDLEGASLGVLVAALDSTDDRLVVSALDLLAVKHREKLIPRAVLNYRSPAVLVKALEVLGRSGRTDLDLALEPLYSHDLPEVRVAAVRARIALGASGDFLRRIAADPDPEVRALSAMALGDAVALASMKHGPLAVRIALLDAAGDASMVLDVADGDPHVIRATARAAARLRDPRLIPYLIAHLSIGAVRHEVRQALIGFGDRTLEALEQALEDPATPLAVRRHLPRTISLLGTPRAAAILVRNLTRQPDGGVRFKILRALGQIASEHPEMKIDRAPLVETVIATAEKVRRYDAWRWLLERAQAEDPRRATDCGRLLGAMLADKSRLALNRVFRLLAVLYPEAKIIDIYAAVTLGTPLARANAIEILENLLSPELRGEVVPLCDPDDPERVPRALLRRFGLSESYDALVAALRAVDDDTLVALANHHRSELELEAPAHGAEAS